MKMSIGPRRNGLMFTISPLPVPFIPKPQLTPFQSGSLRMENKRWEIWELAEN